MLKHLKVGRSKFKLVNLFILNSTTAKPCKESMEKNILFPCFVKKIPL